MNIPNRPIAVDYEASIPPETDPVMPHEDAAPRWSLAKRILFRFGLLYFLMYTHPFPLDYIPDPASMGYLDRWESSKEWRAEAIKEPAAFYVKLGEYQDWQQTKQNAAVDWTAENVFGIETDSFLDRPLGSGDPTFSYVHMALMLAVAALGCLLWSVVDLRRRHYRALAQWLSIGARYYLATYMLVYGFAKVTQFPFPSPSRLLVPYGDASPMNLLWTFMGFSTAFCMFAGAGEVLAGVLLLFRRTTTLGGLVTVAVMANVTAMNFAYDTPVKLFSSHLLLLGALLALPDIRRVMRVFVLNRSSTPRDLSGPFRNRVGMWACTLVKVIILVNISSLHIDNSVNGFEALAKRKANPPPLFGIWDVEEYAQDGEVRPALQGDLHRWQNMVVDFPNGMQVRWMNDRRTYYGFRLDEEAGTATMTGSSLWGYEFDSEDQVTLKGEFSHYARKNPHVYPKDPSDPTLPRNPQIAIRMVRVADSAAGTPRPEESGAGGTSEEGIPEEAGTSESGSAQSGEEQVPEQDEAGKPEGTEEPAQPKAEEPTVPNPFTGTWRVESVDVIGDVLNTRCSDPNRWKLLTVDAGGQARVQFDDDQVDTYGFALDPKSETVSFTTSTVLNYSRPEDGQLIIDGDLRGHTISVRMTHRDLDEFLLVRRGYHWINETPLNR